MTKKSGFYWHVHHDELLEWCYDAEERIDFIKNRKPAHEIETRLTWFQPVKGKLPDAVIDAGEAHNKAYEEACDKAYEEASDKARVAYNKASEAYLKTHGAYRKALSDHKDEIEALHAKEQPGCPWDGETLVFPRGE